MVVDELVCAKKIRWATTERAIAMFISSKKVKL